jgi:hypothetical protein
MARRKTMDELLQEAEAGQSGGTLAEQERKQRELVPTPDDTEDEKRRKRKRGFFEGRRDLPTILNPFGRRPEE